MNATSNLPVPVALRHSARPPVDGRIPLSFSTARAPRMQRGLAWRLPLALAVAATVGISVLLIPRGQEEALLLLEAGDLAGARTLLERRYAEGEHSPALIATLARVRARAGDPAGAAALLEPLAAERPRDRDVVDALVAYRRQLGTDRAGLLRALTVQQALAPSTARLREIAGLHGQLGQVDQQREALRALLADDPGLPGDYLALARLEAAAGMPAAGLATLRRMARLHPRAMDAHAAALTVSLYVRDGRAEAAATAARDWLASQPAAEAARAAPMLASFLGAAQRHDLAALLLEPLAGPAAPTALVLALAQAEIDARREEAALTRLERIPPQDSAEGLEVARLRLRLALAMGETDRALAALEAMPAGQPAADVVASLAAVAVDAGRPDVLARIIAWGGAEALAADPMVATEAAVLLGDQAAARRWAEAVRVAAAARTEPARVLGYAAALMRLGERDQALAALSAIPPGTPLPAAMLAGFARGFIERHQAADGALLIGALRRRQPSPAADGAWALVAAGDPAQAPAVAEWLGGMSGPEPFANLLSDIVHVATDAGAPVAAIAAARQLVARTATDAHLLQLARLLLDAGRAKEALEPLRALQARGVEHRDLYETALLAASRQGDAEATAELRRTWSARLASPASEEERGAALAMLVELGGADEMLPALRRLAEEAPDRWLWTYTEAATKAGRRAEVTAVWTGIARQESLPTAFRRQIAYGLLERGARAEAEAVFRSLAAHAPPDSADVRQLLFVWGPRPGAPALAWLEARARAAGSAERATWMRLLAERGGAQRAIAVYRATGGTEGGPAREAYLAALGIAGDRAGMAATVRAELARETSPERLQALAIMAGQSGDAALEDRALRALVLAGGGDAAARRRVGLNAYRDGELPLAERVLGDHARATGGDSETLFVLGEIRTRRNDAVGARRHYEAALRRLPAGPAAGTQDRRMQATLLRRVGRGRDALPIYEALLAERPGDRHLRADLVSLLIEERNYGRAQTVLAGR